MEAYKIGLGDNMNIPACLRKLNRCRWLPKYAKRTGSVKINIKKHTGMNMFSVTQLQILNYCFPNYVQVNMEKLLKNVYNLI